MTTTSDGGKVRHRALRQIEIGKHRGSLATRILLVSVLSVLVTSSIALAVSFPLLRQTTDNQTRAVLAEQADTLVDAILLGPDTEIGQQLIRGLVREFEEATGTESDGNGHGPGRESDNRVIVVPVTIESPATGPISAEDIALVVSGGNLSFKSESGAVHYFVEGRALSPGQGVFLIQRTAVVDSNVRELLSGMVLALLVGLAFAIALALFVARRTARPMHDAAAVAGELAAGNRDVELRVEGPVEIADISRALNLLAANLDISENRQREFLMSISHELRTPMTSIKGYAEALADGVIEIEELPEVGALLTTETARLERLVTDLLDLARAQAIEFKLDLAEMDLAEVLRTASEAWRLRAEKLGLHFEYKSELESAKIKADATRVRQIVDNLLENAVRVTPAEGLVQLSLTAAPNGFSLNVADSGPGLQDADLAVAFQPAVLHERYRGIRAVGTGLGLALVGTLATRMGATATAAQSELGGASFAVEFPTFIANSTAN